MKSLSLESIHSNLTKSILLVESYSNCKQLSFIIKSCRLMPIELPNSKKKNILLYRHWIDEFNNSLKINKKKKISIICNDLFIERDKFCCTDLYYGLSIEKICKISRLMYLIAGIDEDSGKEIYYLSFLGIDNYFRTYFYDQSWKQISTLHLGLDNLKLIIDNLEIENYLEFDNLKNMPYPCSRANQWLTSLPISQECVEKINKKYTNLSSIIKFNKESYNI